MAEIQNLHGTIDDLSNQFSDLSTNFNHGFGTIVEAYGTLVTALNDIAQATDLATAQKTALAALQVTGESINFPPAPEYALRAEVVAAQVVPDAPTTDVSSDTPDLGDPVPDTQVAPDLTSLADVPEHEATS